MDIEGWNQRYLSRERRSEDLAAAPTPLVMETAATLGPGRALDLACGAGRNAIWLAEHGWRVTAIDGAPAALDLLRARAASSGLSVDAQAADLSSGELGVQHASYDLVIICYYLARELFEPAKAAVKPGGSLLAIVHITEGNEEPTLNRLRPGELRAYFSGWRIRHDFEGKPGDPAHRRSVAEIVAVRPGTQPN